MPTSCMPVNLMEFLALPLLEDARVVAGAQGVDQREIRWISVIEWPVEDFVRPGELVLTSGIACDAKMLKQLVLEIIESGAAGLCIGVGSKRPLPDPALFPFIEAVPEEIKSLANERQFPVIEIPWDLRFADITKAVVDLIVADQYSQLDRVDTIPTEFWSNIMEGRGFEGLALALEQLLDNAVIILSGDFRFEAVGARAKASLGEAGLARCQQAMTQLTASDLRKLNQISYSRTPRACPGLPPLHLGPGTVAAAVVNRRVLGYLYALDGETIGCTVGVGARALEQALAAIAVESLRQHAAAQAEARLHGDALWALATGWSGSPNELCAKAALLGYDTRARYEVMLINCQAPPRMSTMTDGTRALHFCEETERILLRSARSLGFKIVMGRRDSKILVLLEIAGRVDRPIRKLAEQMQKELDRVGRGALTCGLAGTPRRLMELNVAFSEAQSALEVGELVGSSCVADARELGALVMLKQLGQDEQARASALHLLDKLIKYDRKSGRELLQTLEVYLEERSNASASARRLLLNRHSLLYRLRKIEGLTGCSLERYSDLFLLDLSIKLLRFGVLTRDRKPEVDERRCYINREGDQRAADAEDRRALRGSRESRLVDGEDGRAHPRV